MRSFLLIFANLAICSTYIFKPIGGLILGIIGDVVGRRFTLYITTTATAAACLVTAFLPTYKEGCGNRNSSLYLDVHAVVSNHSQLKEKTFFHIPDGWVLNFNIEVV